MNYLIFTIQDTPAVREALANIIEHIDCESASEGYFSEEVKRAFRAIGDEVYEQLHPIE